MRVTNSMMTKNLLANVNKNLQKMSSKQDELATGKRIHTASDDPVLASKVLARRTDLSELEQYDKNTRDALGWIEITEKALEDNGNIFQRIRELTVQAANGTNTAEDTQKIKLEIENMREQLISNANSTFAGRYIFSGFETDKGLLKEDGTFNIDVGNYSLVNKPVVKYEIGVGESIDVMTSGLDIYGTVDEVNVMNSSFPSGTVQGTTSTKEKISGTFDLTTSYAADNLDVTLGGVTYSVNTASLTGSSGIPITKEEILSEYNNAPGGGGTLSDLANIYFDANDELVIESKSYGPGIPVLSQASGIFTTTLTPGVAKVEAVLNNGGATFVDPLTADDKSILINNDISIVINGISRKVRPGPSSMITDVAAYLAEINIQLDAEFGVDIVDVTAPAGVLTFTTKNTSDSIQPEILVDFPRVHESQLIADVDDLIGYLQVADSSKLSDMLGVIDDHMNNMLSLRADVGARSNRMDLVSKRIASSNVSFTKMLSDAEDADMSEVIMELKNAENVYKASLSAGARIIQPSLIDFLR